MVHAGYLLITLITMNTTRTLDHEIPRYSYEKTLEAFPDATTFDYPNPGKFDKSALSHDFSLQLPAYLDSARARVGNKTVDLRYSLIRHDTLRGTDEKTVGRAWTVAQPLMRYGNMVPSDRYTLNLAPVAASLASAVVDKNVSAAATAIRVLFPEQQPNEAISLDARATIRSLAGLPFSPERLVWRLATLYCAASWARVHGGTLGSGTRDILQPVRISSVSAYSAYLSAIAPGTNVVAFSFEGFGDQLSQLVAVLALAASSRMELRTTNNIALPTIATVHPALGNVSMVYVGPAYNPVQLGDIQPSDVWQAAQLWCGQHGCMGLFSGYVVLASNLWCSVEPNKDAIFQNDRFELPLPAFATTSTVLTPISTAYVRWRDEGVQHDEPQSHELFLRGALTSLMVGLAVRTWAYRAGMPYIGLLDRANTDGDHILRELRLRANHVPAMFQVQTMLNNMGCTGGLGSVLLAISPALINIAQLKGWWHQHKIAYQWEEVANIVQSVPRCCALLGVVRPLHTAAVLNPGIWYGVDVLRGVSRSVEEALQGVVYVPDLKIAWKVINHHDASVTLHEIVRAKNYRAGFSDWQFASMYRKDFVSAEIVFRLGSFEAALAAHTGPMGAVPWKWYVSRPLTTEDVGDAHAFDGPAAGPAGSLPDAVLASPAVPETIVPVVPEAKQPDVAEPAPPPDPEEGRSKPRAVPNSTKVKVDVLATLLKDSGQSVEWLSQLQLGFERCNPSASAWEERDREGRMRSAWDTVQALDPIEMLKAIPNGQRAKAATIASQVFSFAAPLAHSATAMKGWSIEAVRMRHRAQALQRCSALSVVELEDWTSKSRVAQCEGQVTDDTIARALAAGVSGVELLKIPPKKRGAEMEWDVTAWDRVGEGDRITEDAATNEIEEIIKQAFMAGECPLDMVQATLGYLPGWAQPPQESTPPGAADEEESKDEGSPNIPDWVIALKDARPKTTAWEEGRQWLNSTMHGFGAFDDARISSIQDMLLAGLDITDAVSCTRPVQPEPHPIDSDPRDTTLAKDSDKHVHFQGRSIEEHQVEVEQQHGKPSSTADFGIASSTTPMSPPMQPPPDTSQATPTQVATSGVESQHVGGSTKTTDALSSSVPETHRAQFTE